MAKLYWRVKKKDGKWTWRPLQLEDEFTRKLIDRIPVPEEEE